MNKKTKLKCNLLCLIFQYRAEVDKFITHIGPPWKYFLLKLYCYTLLLQKQLVYLSPIFFFF